MFHKAIDFWFSYARPLQINAFSWVLVWHYGTNFPKKHEALAVERWANDRLLFTGLTAHRVFLLSSSSFYNRAMVAVRFLFSWVSFTLVQKGRREPKISGTRVMKREGYEETINKRLQHSMKRKIRTLRLLRSKLFHGELSYGCRNLLRINAKDLQIHQRKDYTSK